MKSQITIKKIQDLLIKGVQTIYVDDDTSRRMWWASLEIIQKDFLSQNYKQGGIWVASPLPAFNEKNFLNQLHGWLWSPDGFPYFQNENAGFLPVNNSEKINKDFDLVSNYKVLNLCQEDGYEPFLMIITPNFQCVLSIVGEKDKKIILLPGRLTSWKGQEVFIEAVNLVNIELGYEAFYAVILGSDQGRDLYKKKLIRLSEQYRLSKQIRFIDHCKDMALAYKVSDIIVSASTEPEAFGRVAVEAQSMEKPIIASNIGGSNETIIDEKTGFLYEAGNAKSLSNKILKTLKMDETLLKSIGNEGRKNIVQKFIVEKMCFSTYSEYKKLLN